jgi:Zn-dependent M28 family amino/carboxypeptidase
VEEEVLTRRRWNFLFSLTVLLAGFAIACSDGEAFVPTSTPVHGSGLATATSTPAPSPTTPPGAFPAPATPAAPTATAGPAASAATSTPAPSINGPDDIALQSNGARILADVAHLADVIGPRPAGSAKELEAAHFLAARLRGLGYEVELQEFTISSPSAREARLSVLSPSAFDIASVALNGAASGSARGRLVAAGIGRPSEIPAAVQGNIALMERGQITFAEKVANARSVGASAVVVFNNEPGLFLGTIAPATPIPVVAISRSDGEALLASVQAGDVSAEVFVGPSGTAVSRNVIARPPGRPCQTVTGGHYDSVAVAPGASDNASGTATVLEIAAVLARSGRMGSNCFVLFGGEELGLLGSEAFVRGLSAEARSQLRAMLNFDMVGVGDQTWLLAGSAGLQQQAAAIAARLGVQAIRGQLGSNTSSDHASFINAGIPAVMFHRLEDPLLHTPQDLTSRVRPELLEQAARMGVALLLELSAGL